MTKEEAKKILACRGNGYSEEDFNDAIEVAFNCIPSLPSNLDEAAEEYCKDRMNYDDSLFFHRQYLAEIFKAGAKWMAGQGFISEGIINQTSGEDTIIELNEHIGYLEDCEEVIVNIRKKQ